MNKFIKTLIVINGLLIPVVVLILLVAFIINEFRTSGYDPDPVKTENLITKDGDTLITQGLLYDNPEQIYNSSYHMIRISPKTYNRAMLKDSYSDNFEGGSYSKMMYEHYVNILFLDSNYNVLSTLVDKKASIGSVTIPNGDASEKVDTTVKNIGYLIAFEDSNKDKVIDENDYYNLYISDLNGKNLVKVTDNIDVKTFDFINNHKEIFLSFTDRKDIPDEHKIKRFAVYDIASKQLKVLTQLDRALNAVQRILIK